MDQWLHSTTPPFLPTAPWWSTFLAGFVLAIVLRLMMGGKKKK